MVQTAELFGNVSKNVLVNKSVSILNPINILDQRLTLEIVYDCDNINVHGVDTKALHELADGMGIPTEGLLTSGIGAKQKVLPTGKADLVVNFLNLQGARRLTTVFLMQISQACKKLADKSNPLEFAYICVYRSHRNADEIAKDATAKDIIFGMDKVEEVVTATYKTFTLVVSADTPELDVQQAIYAISSDPLMFRKRQLLTPGKLQDYTA